MDALVGHSGFVGGNLMAQHRFGAVFNSTNIHDIKGQHFETLVCSAVPATMWLANNNPAADLANIMKLFDILCKVRVDRFVLVSTIAVYNDASKPVDENSTDYQTALAYGRHRRALEERVIAQFPASLILRLPALFGSNLKKNFLFDMLNPVPSFLKPAVYDAVHDGAASEAKELVTQSFVHDEAAGMWRFKRDEFGKGAIGTKLGALFENAGASAVEFTHADSMFQFYGLHALWQDIEKANKAGIDVLNLATEPLRAGGIYYALKGQEMTAQSAQIVTQDMRSRHSEIWGRRDGYLRGGGQILADLKAFYNAENGPEL